MTTEHFAAITIRSCKRLILLTAAAISAVTPGANAARAVVVASSDNSQITQAADGQMSDWRESRFVMGVNDETSDLIGLVRDNMFVKECYKWQVGKSILRGFTRILARFRRSAGQFGRHCAVARPCPATF